MDLHTQYHQPIPSNKTQLLKYYHGGVQRLSRQIGKKAAVEIIAKHRLIELYLVEEMQFSLDEVHEIAEEIEHIKNTKFFIRMQEILGNAQLDPHGSVIPKCDF